MDNLESSNFKNNISKEMESYHSYNVVPALFTFIEDLTNWYIRLNRNRFWGEGLSEEKKALTQLLYTTLLELSQIMAPFAPFLSEYTFKELKDFESRTSRVSSPCTTQRQRH